MKENGIGKILDSRKGCNKCHIKFHLDVICKWYYGKRVKRYIRKGRIMNGDQDGRMRQYYVSLTVNHNAPKIMSLLSVSIYYIILFNIYIDYLKKNSTNRQKYLPFKSITANRYQSTKIT